MQFPAHISQKGTGSLFISNANSQSMMQVVAANQYSRNTCNNIHR